ncbi:YL1 nuclear protein-domain-containing protein [Echria macrotheca]|uniref:YL1 nuclear protein-domain-containing protein n=1 Tax=Echria macrotheca TaxID=438768 RepID=A0AAJ0F860_9PEZI|nr:YL1 nuclear protein-domain-containing protein [Echria macrotheca]
MASTDDVSRLSAASDDDTTSSSDADSDSGERAQVEWLATTRSRRSTAGNRMKAMLANEEPAAEDSDLELLFAEDEDDAGFSDDAKDDVSDVQMDSSSDEEDQAEGGDDLEGEKELERQAREKRNAQRKRKAQEAIPAKFRKKVRIERPATATATESASPRSSAPPPSGRPPPRPKKKSERLSWLPTAADMPTRASDRKTTKISKELLHQKMVKDEVRRKKQLERMEKNAKRLEALKKPPMTQAERLKEAALVEKRNSKSLNRWEMAEKQREEERLRKIAALNNRKLDGPVVTFWSGIQELEEGQLKHVGKMVSMEEKAPRKKRQSAAAILAAKEQEAAKAEDSSKPASPTENPAATPGNGTPTIKPEASEQPGVPASVPPAPAETLANPEPAVPKEIAPVTTPAEQAGPAPESTAPVPPNLPTDPQQASMPAPAAVLAAPVLAAPMGVSSPTLSRMGMLGSAPPSAKSNCLAAPNTTHSPSPLSLPPQAPGSSDPNPPVSVPAAAAPTAPLNQTTPAAATAPTVPGVPPPTPASAQVHAPVSTVQSPSTLSSIPPHISNAPLQPTEGNAAPSPNPPNTPQDRPGEPPREGKVTRSCIILQNFDENAIKDRQVQTQILFGRKMNKLPKQSHPPHCVITNHIAKYKDPKTGLPYHNSYAYKEIQRVHRGDYKWSRLLGAYVGSGTFAARGVPERFSDPSKPRSTPKAPPETTKAVLAPIEGADGATTQAQNLAEKHPQVVSQNQGVVPAPAQAQAVQQPADIVRNPNTVRNPIVTQAAPAVLHNPQVPNPAPNLVPPKPAAHPQPVAEARLVPIDDVPMSNVPSGPAPINQPNTGR